MTVQPMSGPVLAHCEIAKTGGLQGGLKGAIRLLAVPTPSRSLFLLGGTSY
jgi:hypothetical protein